jgi:hypothetical protein
MTQVETDGVSRRGFLATGVTLLAGFGLATALPEAVAAASADSSTPSDLALFRPVTVSSTDYAATPGSFAVDGVAQVGLRGSGWRAAQGDPQWMVVDLQGQCQVSKIVLTFDAKPGDPAFDFSKSRNQTTGLEILTSYSTSYALDVSTDGEVWTTVYSTTAGTGAVSTVPLAKPAAARWVRFTSFGRSTSNPLGLNGFQVYGTTKGGRPQVTGWTNWPAQHRTPPALTVAGDGTVPIESGWVLTMDDFAPSQDGAALSGPSVNTDSWVPATVPGTVLASLVEQGHFPDPVAGMNNMVIPEALSRHAWWYRRTFAVPSGVDTSAGRFVWLEFDGVNNQADVWLNGKSVGTLSHPFGRAAFDVTGALRKSGDQALAVKISPIPFPGSPGDKGPAGQSFVDAGGGIFANSPTLVAASGWDWMPAVRDRVSGIWDHVRLRSTGAAVLGDARIDTVLPKLPDLGSAELTITVPVRNASGSSQQVTVTAAFDNVKVSSTVTVAAGQSTDVKFDPTAYPQLKLTNPKLWWPNGYGDPNLHALQLTATVGGRTSDKRSVNFGIRKISYDYQLPITVKNSRADQTVDFPVQQARYVRLQGHKRATSYGISLWTLSVINSAAPTTDLALNKTATSSSVDDPGRQPGNAVDGDPNTRWASAWEDDQYIQVDLGSAQTFDRLQLTWEYAYAATFTIQVSNDGSTWTDAKAVDNSPVPMTIFVNGVKVFIRGGSWGWDELLRRMPADKMDSVVAMHRDMNFTLIRNWIGCSYREELFAAADRNGILVWNEFWDGFSADPANHDIFLAQAKDVVLRFRHHPCMVVFFGCNEGTPPDSIDAPLRDIVTGNTDLMYQSNSAGGVISGDGPYHWLDPKQYFTGDATGGKHGFWSEIGIPTVSVVESMRNLVGPGDPGWPVGPAWYLHDWSTQGNQQPQSYQAAIDARLAPSSGLEEFCRKAQFVNYESMRAIFEAWNALLWNDARGVLLWMSHPAWHSTVWQTYDYDLDVNGSYYGSRKGCEAHHVQANLATWQVSAVNHTPTAVSGATVTAQLYDLAGSALGAAQSQQVDIASSSVTSAFTVAFGDSLPALHLLRLKMTDSKGNLLSENTYWRYRADTDMRALNQVAATSVSVSLRQSGNAYSAVVRNTGKTVAAMVRLSLRESNGKDRVLPTLYGDNYFWLLPGESRTVTVSPRKSVSGPRLLVEGYNVPATLS